MSLINDALKRANQRLRKTSTGEPGADNPMQPVLETSNRGNRASVLVVVLLLVLLGVGGWYGFGYWKSRKAAAAPAGTKTTNAIASKTNGPATAKTGVTNPITGLTTENNPIARSKAVFEKVRDQGKDDPASIQSQAPKTPDANSTGTPAPVVAGQTVPSTGATSASANSGANFPPLKLQGIFYRANNPAAMVNGKMVSVGSEVDGAKVVSIDKQSIIMEMNGQTNLLMMRQQ